MYEPMATVKQKPKTIVDLAINDGSFSTLVDALRSADLVGTLKGEGPFTVFAPNDDAFAKLPKGTQKSLMKSTNKSRLQDILKYHVIRGQKMAADLSSVSSVKTLSGDSLRVMKKGNVLHVGDAKIRQTNLEAQNGIVHVIDQVLMPEEAD
jgi:uncharacterized surface protein with fasciclin (FAS1) repeats